MSASDRSRAAKKGWRSRKLMAAMRERERVGVDAGLDYGNAHRVLHGEDDAAGKQNQDRSREKFSKNNRERSS